MATGITVDEVDAAIRVVLGNQRVKLGDREYTFANLAELRDLRAELIAEARAATNSQIHPVRFGRPS